MPQFRAKKLDLGGFVNARIIRDHTKRKVFEKFEEERSVISVFSTVMLRQQVADTMAADKHFATSSETLRCRSRCAPEHN